MTHILLIGANGQLARHATARLLAATDARLSLFLRRAHRLPNPAPARVRMLEGDATDVAALQAAMQGVDVVYASLSGDLPRMATAIVAAMRAAGVRRLIFVSSMGIHGEVPGEPYRSVLDPYRDAAAIVEASGLDYTILRPGWFTHQKGERYQLTQKGQQFIGHDVPLNALAQLSVDLATTPGLHTGCSVGVSTA